MLGSYFSFALGFTYLQLGKRRVTTKQKEQTLSAQDDNEDAAPIMDGNAGDGQGGEKKRKNRTSMDLNEIWKLYNDSVDINGMSLSMLVRSKQNDRQGGASETTSTWWMKKVMKMYCRRASISFMGIKHINIVCDASRHSIYDCLVSVFYTQQNNVACYPPTQSLRSSKYVKPGEIICDSQVEQLLAEGSRTRLSGYRLLQALSHQIELVTESNLNLKSFLVPDELSSVLKPLLPDVTRVVRGNSVRLVATANAAPSPAVNLLDLLELPILVVGMDQGSSGCAAAAFLNDAGTVMCHFYWDGFHRLIRDMKLSITSCPPASKRQLQQGQLCGSYVYSINYKPFQKAGFHEDKRDLLDSFMQTESKEK